MSDFTFGICAISPRSRSSVSTNKMFGFVAGVVAGGLDDECDDELQPAAISATATMARDVLCARTAGAYVGDRAGGGGLARSSRDLHELLTRAITDGAP